MLREFIHYGLHLALPLGVALYFFPKTWKTATIILLCGFIIDLDHLWAQPIFDPDRCSMGFHLLHRYELIPIYLLGLAWKKSRLIALGILLHLIADQVDCWMLIS